MLLDAGCRLDLKGHTARRRCRWQSMPTGRTPTSSSASGRRWARHRPRLSWAANRESTRGTDADEEPTMRAFNLWFIPMLAVAAVLDAPGHGLLSYHLTASIRHRVRDTGLGCHFAQRRPDQHRHGRLGHAARPHRPGAASPHVYVVKSGLQRHLTVAEDSVYAGSGYTAVREQRLQEPGDNRQHFVRQRGAFSAADRADEFL